MKMKLTVLLTVLALLTGCSAFFSSDDRTDRKTSSLVEYLYADDNYVQHEREVPVLNLPLRVGIAFIPMNSPGQSILPLQEEIMLLERVKQAFLRYDYIDRIEIIPSTYLAIGKGFTTIEQIARLHDVDVMALVSYDQISRSQLNPSSLLYWTIVGAYVIPGNSNTTQTFVDTAVFDVNTRKLLFRAPGADRRKSYATAVGLTNEARVKSTNSFHNAVLQMNVNLDQELNRFTVRVKEEKIAEVKVRKGYTGTGAGSFGGPSLLLMLLMLAARTNRLSRITGSGL